MVLLHALDADREGLQSVNERNAEVQARPGDRIELAEAGDHGALVLSHREEGRDEIEAEQSHDHDGEGDDAEKALGDPAAARQLRNGKLSHRSAPDGCENNRCQPLGPASYHGRLR
jgi:hypothetical protein